MTTSAIPPMARIVRLADCCAGKDLAGALAEIQQLVPDYTPSAWLMERAKAKIGRAHV